MTASFKNKTAEELAKLLAEKREALREFRFGTSGAKTKNVLEGRNLRRDIARLLTEKKNVGGTK